jgi:hypothetical protein
MEQTPTPAEPKHNRRKGDKIREWCSRMPIVGPSLGKIWHELAVLIINAILLFYYKEWIQHPAMQLLMFKMLLINAGIVHATITRKVIFPYIEFETETDSWKKALVIVFYAVIIYAYSAGG